GKDDLQKMAPNLGNVSKRLRPEWVKAWLSAPMNWLPYTKMLTLWSDPYATPLPWDKVAVTPAPKSGEDQIEMVRDFLFTLTPDTVWPKSGEEAKSAVVQGGSSGGDEGPSAEADKSEKGGKGKEGKGRNKQAPKKHGSIGSSVGSTG